MIKDEDLLADSLTMLSHYGHTYQYLIDLLKAQSWQQFYPLLVEIGKRDRSHNRQEELINYQCDNVQYLLTLKLSKFDKWASIDFQQVIPSLKYLRKSVNYTLSYSAIHNKIPNLVDVCWLLFSQNCEDAKSKEMSSQFFTSNMEIIYNPECNKQSFNYQYYQKLNEEEKSLFEIVAIACQSKIVGIKFDKSKKEDAIKKYVNTQNPKRFQYLLQIDSDSNDYIKAEVLNLRLQKEENQWKLVGDCRVSRKCLTSTNLNRCLSTYKYSYKYLVDNFFVENEEGIFFKFNVLQLIPTPSQEQTVFNCLLKEEEKVDELREYCKKILQTALHLIQAVQANKPLFFYKDAQVKVIKKQDQEKLLFFILKMLSYPFRTYHRQINDENVVEIEVQLEQIRAPLTAFMRKYECEDYAFSPTAFNNLCQIFRWIDENSKYTNILQALFSKEENTGEDSFAKLYGKLLRRYLRQNKDKQLPYHAGIWLLKYFAPKSKTKQLLKEDYNEFCLQMYRFFAKSNKYLKVAQYEMDKYFYQSKHKRVYYNIVQLLLKNNPDFITIVISQWMRQLEYFQQNKDNYDRSRTYRISLLVIVFNCQHFPVTEEIKERLRKVILSYDYKKLTLKKYKEIWAAFASKVELKLLQLIETNLEQLLKITQDEEILSKHYATKYFRAYVSQEAQLFTRKLCLLDALLNMNTTPLPQQVVIKMTKLFLRINVIQIKNIQSGQTFASQQAIQTLQKLQQWNNASFGSDIFSKSEGSIDLLKDHLGKGKLNMIINNAIIIELGSYLNYIQQNYKSPYTSYELLYQLSNFIRLRSSTQQCQFFLQFYNYYKKEIINLLESFFQYYAFKFDDSNNPKNENDVFQYSLRLKKQGKNVLQEREKLSICHLQVKIKEFICQIFANQNWEYTILVNNTRYDKINCIKLFEKSVQDDLTARLLKIYSPEKLPFFHRLYVIIDNAYHRRTREDLNCSKGSFNFVLPQQPITIFTKTAELSTYYQTYTDLIKESFKYYKKYEDSKMLEQFYNSLISSFEDEEKTKLKKLLLKQLIKQLELVLSSADITWEIYEKIHACINVMLESYEEPIGQFLTKELIQTYMNHIVGQVKSQAFKEKQTKVFLKFVERLIPHSKPEVADEIFHSYTVAILSVCTELLKTIAIQEIKPEIISLIAKIIRFQDPLFNSQIINLFKNVQSMKDNFSQLLCEAMQKSLRLASIQLELKCFFLKLYEKNDGDWEKTKVKISQFIPIFSKKHRFHKKEFIQVVETLTKKESIKQENKKINYLRLSSVENLQYSIYLKCRFADFDFNGIFKPILASYFDNINKDPNLFKMKVRQLRIIVFNYPLLASYILMHPMTEGQNTAPFVDYLFKKITTEDLDEEIYDFFAYTAIDFCHIINFKGRAIFFSQYLCHRLVCKAAETQMNNRNIIFIFFMAKIKKFADYCFTKIKDGKSLYQILWERLKTSRQQFTFKENTNILLYITISLLSRWNTHKKIMSFCDYRQKASQWDWLNGFTNECLYPWKGLVLKKEYEDVQLLQVKIDFEKPQENFEELQLLFSKYYVYLSSEKEPCKSLNFDSKVQIKPEHLKHIGSISKSHSQDYFDIQSAINTSYDQPHRSAIQSILVYFLQYAEQKSSYARKRRRMKDNTYNLYEDLQNQESDNDKQEDDNEALNDEVNANRQSRFAPEEFVRTNNRVNDDDDDSDFEDQLENRFNKLQEEEKTQKVNDQKGEDKEEEFTHQMLNLMSKINETLAFLQRAPLTIEDMQGKTLQEKHEFLKIRDLQTDFDYKESTMGIQQFQNYCLSNVSKLDRLGSERRNIVRNIQDTMLLKFVQRSVSSDSVDYIIDTIDQNYQLLPNTLQHKNSVGAMQEIIKNTSSKKPKSIKSSQLPAHIFEDLTDDQLYEIILSYYYCCAIFPINNYFIPFLENKRLQEKIINTLLYIYHHPFDNKLFPQRLQSYNLQKSLWIVLDKPAENTTDIHDKITQTFMNCIKQSFYEQENYLNLQINRKGIKDIVFEPSNQIEQNGETYRPIYQVIQLCLESQIKTINENQDYECENVFNLFRGVTQIKDSQLDKLLVILQKIHALFLTKSQNQGETIDSDEIYNRMTSDKCYQIPKNLGELLKIQRVKQAIRGKFPIEQPERDPFFISLFIDTGIYSREQIMKLHRAVIGKDEAKSNNVYFVNQVFKLYSQQQIKECSEIKTSKKIIPYLVKTLQKKLKLKEQHFYKICAFPEVLSLDFKAQVLYRKVKEYKKEFCYNGSEEVVAQRKKGIFQSAFLDLRNKPDGFWYLDFSVKFMNVDNVLQSGYGRGVAKDWYAYVTKGMANLNYGIFMKTSKNYYFFNRESWINPRHLQFLQFIGKLFAISIINKEMYVAPSFSILLYKMIMGEKIEIADIVKEFDEGEVITNIEKLREYQDDSLFCETFTYEDKRLISNKNLQILKRKRSKEAIESNLKENNLYLLQEAVEMKTEQTEQDLSGMKEQERLEHEEQAPKMIKVLKIGQSIELIPGGAEIPVTMENREQFITLTKKKIYDTIINGVQQQFNAFMIGFKRVVKPDFIKNIIAEELRELAQGCDKIQIEDLKKNVTLARGMDKNPQLQWFWSSLVKLSARDRMYFIQHWTGLPKISAQGFKGTNLTIVKGNYNGRLFAQTCFNKLHMPEFQCQEKMEQAIRMAINSVKIGQSIIED